MNIDLLETEINRMFNVKFEVLDKLKPYKAQICFGHTNNLLFMCFEFMQFQILILLKLETVNLNPNLRGFLFNEQFFNCQSIKAVSRSKKARLMLAKLLFHIFQYSL